MELTTEIGVGPFVLERQLGRGAMGTVWRGRHAAQGVPVAVKVMTAPDAREEDYLEAFAHEVRAVARLDHTHIIRVFDHGRLAAGVPAVLGPGAPYLVMEYIGCGSLDAVRLDTWSALCQALAQLLDGLAHAHARGVVHRDLKPANVLVDRIDRTGLLLKLTDFGIAHAVDDVTGSNVFGTGAYGTPSYMAPEQIEGSWRKQGPWTDLYALGCLAWRLATGSAPYSGEDAEMMDVLRGHLFDPLPPLSPAFGVPDAFEEWLHHLLQKHPAERYQRAADALHALREIDRSYTGSSAGRRSAASTPGLAHDVDTVVTLPVERPDTAESPAGEGMKGPTTATGPVAHPDDAPTSALETLHPDALAVLEGRRSPPPAPVPSTYERPLTRDASMSLVGAGLSLFGLRPVPFVDRDDERERIWTDLRTVARTRRVRGVVIDGAAGTGKTRLAEWLTERAHETGAAHVLRATHSEIPGPADGIARMVANTVRCVGLGREAAMERLDAWLDDRAVTSVAPERLSARRIEDQNLSDALVELITPRGEEDATSEDDPRVVRFSSPRERYAVVRSFLARMCAERPAIVWLDDAQWGSDALDFAHYMASLPEEHDIPVLLLLTVRDSALAQRPMEHEQVSELLEREVIRRIEIEPLDPAHHHELVERLLGLSSTLVEDVAERTHGHPLFAVHLVGDWVQRGVLRVGSDGFELRPGAEAPLPDNIHELWLARVDAAVARADGETAHADIIRALEIAAALGTEIDTREWQRVCELGDTEIPDGLMEALVRSRLAIDEVAGTWSLSHGMLRESLERHAREAGRWTTHHAHCAAMLEPRYERGEVGVGERLGRHLVAAGELEAAVDPLYDAAHERAQTADFRRAHALFGLHGDVLDRLGVEAEDRRRIRADVRQADAYMAQGRLDDAERLAESTRDVAAREGWAELEAHALWVQSMIAARRGNVRDGLALAEQAQELWAWAGDRSMEGYALCGVGRLRAATGETGQAIAAYTEARDIFTEEENAKGLGQALVGLADAVRRAGDIERAQALATEALEHRRRLGDRLGVTRCLNMLGEIERARGELDAARDHYEQSLRLLDALGAREATIVRINLGIVRIARRDYDGARRVLARARSELEHAGRAGFAAVVRLILLPCHAHHAHWGAFDEMLDGALEGLEASGLVDPDIAAHATLAGELALEAREYQRARRVLEIARAQWMALGRDDDVATVTAMLESFDG